MINLTIENFRPRTDNFNRKFLYLTQKYNEVLNFYINEWDGKSNYYSDMSTEYLEEKVNLLGPKILLFHKHWVSGYIYHSFPRMTQVVFNNNFTRAYIDYTSSWCTGGTDEYSFVNSEWIFIRHVNSWIT